MIAHLLQKSLKKVQATFSLGCLNLKKDYPNFISFSLRKSTSEGWIFFLAKPSNTFASSYTQTMNKILILLLALLLQGCGTSVEIEGFDNQAWKKDKNGCQGLRKTQYDVIFEKRQQLKGVRENVIKSYLGMPDQQDLQTRGQKMYRYWVAGNPDCANGEVKKLLVIRFNALNQANEVFAE